MRRRLREAGVDDDDAALAAGLITEGERLLLAETQQAMLAAIAVDSFTPAELLEFAPIRRRPAAEHPAGIGPSVREQEDRCELPT